VSKFTAVLLLCAIFGAGVTVAAADWWAPAQAAAKQTFVIEVSEAGFNPAVCKLSRGDTVTFKNVGTQPRRVVWDSPTDGSPLYDSGEIAPGTLAPLSFSGFEFPNRWTFHDTFDPALKTIVITPTFANSWDPNCAVSADGPQPPPATPAPPADCATAVSCVRVVALAADK
jgi:plastocyanin